MTEFVVYFWNGETNKARSFKTLDEAQNFIWVCRKMRPEYTDFRIKTLNS